MAWNTDLRWRLPLTCLLLQVALVVLFGVFVRYNPDADAHWVEDKQHANSSSDLDNEFYYRYPSKCRRPAGPRSAQLSGSPPGPESCLAAPLQPTLGARAGAGVGDAAHGPPPSPTKALLALGITPEKWLDAHELLFPGKESQGNLKGVRSLRVPSEVSSLLSET